MGTISIRREAVFRLVGGIVAVVAALISAGQNAAVADGPVSVTLTSADDSAFPTVTAVVLADEAGKPLPSLSPDELSVTENGKPADVVSVTPSSSTRVPLELVLAIDTSGSMADISGGGGTKLSQAQAAAIGLLKSLAQGDRAALIGFDQQVRVEQPATADLSLVINAIGRLSPRGNTALYDAVGKATELASQAQNPRRAVVLLTDGNDFGGISTLTREASLARTASTNTIFYTIGVGSDADTAYLTQLANGSGGHFFPAAEGTDLPAISAAIQEQLRSYFVLTVRSTAEASGTERTIQVSIQSGGSQSSGSLAYTSLRPAVAVSTPEPPAAPIATAPAVASPPKAAATQGDSNAWLPFVGAAAVGLIPIGALVLLLAANRQRAGLRLRPEGPPVAFAGMAGMLTQSPANGRPAPVVNLTVSQRGEVRRFPLKGTLRIGSAPDNEIVLGSGDGIAPYHARISIRDGRVVLHHLAPGFETLMSGQSIDWASVEPGADVTIGSATLNVETG